MERSELRACGIMGLKTTSSKCWSEENLSSRKAMEPFIQLTKETLDDSYRDFLSKKEKLVVWAQQKPHTWEIKQNSKSTIFLHGRALTLENFLTKRIQDPQAPCSAPSNELMHSSYGHLGAQNAYTWKISFWVFEVCSSINAHVRYVCLPQNTHF